MADGDGKREKNRLLYINANTYRIHQDTLRWTLAGTYAVLFGASINFANPGLASIFFFLIGTAYLFILAAESWYYNRFVEYVKECEERIHNGIDLRTLDEFKSNSKIIIKPTHLSYTFIFSIVTCCNSYYIYKALNSKIYSFCFII